MFLIIHPIASHKLKIFKFDQEIRPLQRKRIFSEILAENPAPPYPKTWISQNLSIFLIVDPKTSCKPKIVTLDQKMRHLLQKKQTSEIFTENQAPP